MNPVNSTISTVSALSDLGGNSWVITVIVFLGIIFTIFFVSKNFRQFIYGAFITIILYGIYSLSRWIGVSTSNQNFEPIKWAGYIAGFILLSILVGKIFDKTGLADKFENSIDPPIVEDKNKEIK